jgi:hypothetical protein
VPLWLKKRGYEVYTIDGEIAVDRVCLFENLKEELERIRVLLALPESLTLPRAKSSFRSDKRHYRDILGDDERDKIGQIFAEEISLHGYEF